MKKAALDLKLERLKTLTKSLDEIKAGAYRTVTSTPQCSGATPTSSTC